VAEKYGANLLRVDDYTALASSATAEQLRELGAVYQEIARREDAIAISRWIDECDSKGAACPFDEKRLSNCILCLLRLFDYLADRSLPPFISRQVGYIEQRRDPDWSTLAKNLAYLACPAERFGKYGSENEIMDFIERASHVEIEELSTLSMQIRTRGHASLIREWLNSKPFTQYQEAWQVYCLLGVMDCAGFTIDRST
jgi:hypothetical protein